MTGVPDTDWGYACAGDIASVFMSAVVLVPGDLPLRIATPRFSRPISERAGDNRDFLAPLVQAAVLDGAQDIARKILGQEHFRDLDRELLRDMGFQREATRPSGCEAWSFGRDDSYSLFVYFFNGEADLAHWAINGRGLSRKDFFSWFLRELKSQVVDDVRENMA
jgi:hypothetical protein